MEKTCEDRKREEGSCHPNRGCQRCERQGRVEKMGRWPILSEERGNLVTARYSRQTSYPERTSISLTASCYSQR